MECGGVGEGVVGGGRERVRWGEGRLGVELKSEPLDRHAAGRLSYFHFTYLLYFTGG